jgi:hypothetical protein
VHPDKTPTTADVTAGIMTALAELAEDAEGRPWRDRAVLRSARRLSSTGPFRAVIFSPLDPYCGERAGVLAAAFRARRTRVVELRRAHPLTLLPYAGFVSMSLEAAASIEPGPAHRRGPKVSAIS